jgi:hypothetical protein
MIRKTIVLLIVIALLIPAVIAEPAIIKSGTCSLADFDWAIGYTGVGEFKQVSTSDVDMHYECHGRLSEYSSVPDKAIVMKYDVIPLPPPWSDINYIDKITITITPSGLFTVIVDRELYVPIK